MLTNREMIVIRVQDEPKDDQIGRMMALATEALKPGQLKEVGFGFRLGGQYQVLTISAPQALVINDGVVAEVINLPINPDDLDDHERELWEAGWEAGQEAFADRLRQVAYEQTGTGWVRKGKLG